MANGETENLRLVSFGTSARKEEKEELIAGYITAGEKDSREKERQRNKCGDEGESESLRIQEGEREGEKD